MAKRTLVYNDIIIRALKIINICSEADQSPTAFQMETARDVFSDLLDRLEMKGIRVFRREWRTRTFESASRVTVNSENYECIQSHTSVNASTWASATAYSEGDIVYPTTYNGMYYVAQADGTSGASQPTWDLDQDSLTADNTVSWKAFADNKPGVGKNWISFWVKRDSGDSNWAVNTEYRAAGTFDLKDDEIQILAASIARESSTIQKLTIIDDYTYGESRYVGMEGCPIELYVSSDGLYNKQVQLFPNPDVTGANGYVLHYLVNKRGSDASEGSETIDYPTHWSECLNFMLASSLCPYFQIERELARDIDARAEQLYKELIPSDINSNSGKGVAPCWG